MPLSTQVRLLVLSGVVFVSVLILKIREERDSHSCRAAAQRPGLPVCQTVGDVPEQEHGVSLRLFCSVL